MIKFKVLEAKAEMVIPVTKVHRKEEYMLINKGKSIEPIWIIDINIKLKCPSKTKSQIGIIVNEIT